MTPEPTPTKRRNEMPDIRVERALGGIVRRWVAWAVNDNGDRIATRAGLTRAHAECRCLRALAGGAE